MSQDGLPPFKYAFFAPTISNEHSPPRMKEAEKVPPVPKERIDKTLLFLAPQLRTMVLLQLHTAMRPDEVTIMRLCDIDQSDEVWTYTPAAHKTENHGLSRPIYLGPKCQDFLQP